MALSDSFVKKEFSPEVEREVQQREALLEEMGLEDRSVEKLKKTLLSPNEAIIAKNEELTHIRQHKGQRDYWEEFIDAKRRMGRLMHHSEFTTKLKSLIPSLIYLQGAQRNRLGLYIIKNVPADEIEGYRGSFKFVECPIYIGWMEMGYSPEYEIDKVNDAMVAVGQRRGWRTILLNLIARKDQLGRPTPIISEDDCYRVFGFPSNGDTSSFFRMRLWKFRNGRA